MPDRVAGNACMTDRPGGGDPAVFGCCTAVQDGAVFVVSGSKAALFKAGKFRTVRGPPTSCGVCCTLSDGTVFLLGGEKGNESPREACVLDLDTYTYTPATGLPFLKGTYRCISLSDRRVLIHGEESAFIYDVGTNACSLDRSIHMPPHSASCVLPDGRLFVCGGRGANAFGVSTELSDSCVSSLNAHRLA
jgi:WD40 repeat protein